MQHKTSPEVPSRQHKPVPALTLTRLILLNILCWILVLPSAFIQNNPGLFGLAVLPLGLCLGVYVSIGKHGFDGQKSQQEDNQGEKT